MGSAPSHPPSPPERDLPFDTIRVATSGGPKTYTLASFMALPLQERLSYVFQKQISFSLNGEGVDQLEALKALGRVRGYL
jgi:hypothetical protein